MLACEISSTNPSLRRAMEVSGAILKGVPAGCMPGHRRDGGDLALSISGKRIRMSARPRGGGGFSDEGHLKYYVQPVRCGARTKEEKRRSKLVRGLTKDLSALSSMDLAVEAGEGVACESKGKMVSKAAEILLAQLKQLRAEEKEMKRRRKVEKAAKMKACEDEDSSSSSSSESSDSECETVVDISSLRTEAPPTETKSEVQPIPIETPSVSNALSLPLEPKAEVKLGLDSSSKQLRAEEKEMKRRRKVEKATKMKACEDEDSSSSSSSESSDSECETVVDISSLRTEAPPTETKSEVQPIPIETPSGSNALSLPLEPKAEVKLGLDSSTNSAASNCCKTSSALAERIEVCMGGKCKKSGAMELMEELERKVVIQGAVVGCKCMGKCREGPNVRVLNHSTGEDSFEPVKNMLCIGVGLEDVGNIVANFFGENKDAGLMAA